MHNKNSNQVKRFRNRKLIKKNYQILPEIQCMIKNFIIRKNISPNLFFTPI